MAINFGMAVPAGPPTKADLECAKHEKIRQASSDYWAKFYAANKTEIDRANYGYGLTGLINTVTKSYSDGYRQALKDIGA